MLKTATAILLTATSCVTTSPEPEPATDREVVQMTAITTEPSGAMLTFPDGTDCFTPCGVYIITEMPMTISRAGFETVSVTIPYPAPPTLSFTLSPVGRSTDVEEGQLPDL